MMRFLPVVLLATAACGSSATPVGSTIVRWKITESDRVPIRTSVVESEKVFERDFVAYPMPESAVRLRVKVAAAKVSWIEADETETHFAPVTVSAKLLDGDGYRFARVECNGPDWEVPDADQPEVMFVRCFVTSKKRDVDVLMRIRVFGNGRVDQL